MTEFPDDLLKDKKIIELHTIHPPVKFTAPIMKHFAYEHLPEKLQKISAPICDIARVYENSIPDSAEKTAGLRKLLEAKDCLVRAGL
jgi:hypothetical protein